MKQREGFPSDPTEFCISDVGSTTTKTILFRKEAGWRFHRREAATTVEKPYEDVTVGLLRALEALETDSGLPLIRDGRPAVPYLSTSSAGGGLAMVVTGLVRDITAVSADRVAMGAGALVLDVIAMDDGRTPYQKIEALKQLRPDMVLLAGGFDSDAVTGPVFLAELIVESGLHPKLNPDAKLPVIYAGNINATDYTRRTLSDRYHFHPVPNIRPRGNEENLEPARGAIHDLFMDHVMSQAPGYEQLKTWVRSPIRPTPAAFGAILELVSRKLGGRILAIDIGGATTDIFTAQDGRVFRTVSANLGMSYSIRNVAETAGADAILTLLGPGIGEEELWDRIGKKHVNPTALPATPHDVELEWATATIAIREAVRAHLEVMRGIEMSLGKAELEISKLATRRVETHEETNDTLSIEGYDLMIGSGGILSHSPREAAAMMMIDALQPRGAVELAVDSAFMFPHLGVLGDVNPELACELFFDIGIVRLGTLLAPTDGPGRSANLNLVGDTSSGARLEESIPQGNVRVIPLAEGDCLRVAPGSGFDRSEFRGGECGLIVDTRPRPIGERAAALIPREITPLSSPTLTSENDRVKLGPIRLPRELAIPGQVFVKQGDRVSPNTLVARSIREFLRPFFLTVAQALGVEPDDAPGFMVKKIGDEIEQGEIIAKKPRRRFIPKVYRSPVDGRIEKFIPGGIVVVREKPELAREFVTVDAAKKIGVKPKHLRAYLKCEPGQEVDRGQWLAANMPPTEANVCKSPIRGRVNRIDLDFGMVIVEPLYEQLDVQAWLPGIVDDVTEKGCAVTSSGAVIQGIWGTGGERYGTLVTGNAQGGEIELRQSASTEDFGRLREAGAAGLITGGMHLSALLDEPRDLTIIVTEEFGATRMESGLYDLLAASEGRLCLADGTTQLRVGVKRPTIILPD